MCYTLTRIIHEQIKMLKITKPCSVLLKPIESSAKMGKLLIQFEERTGEYMEYMSAPQAAEKWGISERRVQILCSENRIPGVSKLGYMWLIPKDAEKPMDKRRKIDKNLNE